jgi:hypothetical protein
MKTQPRAAARLDCISRDAIYPLPVFLRRLGLGRHSFRELRRLGLPVFMFGRRAYIDGAKAVECLRALAEQHTDGSGGGTSDRGDGRSDSKLGDI